MKRHTSLLFFFQLALSMFAPAKVSFAEIRSGPNVNIVASDPFSQKQLEVEASANPRNPNHIFAGYIDYQTALTEAQRVTSKGRCGYSFSINGGKTWKNGLLPVVAPNVDKCGDPAVAWDTNGHVFYFALSELNDGVTTIMSVWRLTDPDDGTGTLLSGPPVQIDLGNTGQDLDKGSIIFQPDATSSNPNAPGTLYVCYSIFTGGAQNNLKVICAISRDGGNTYTKPNQGKYNGNINSNNGTAAAAGPNGSIYLFWRAFTGTENGYYFVKVSPNGNATPPIRIVGGSQFYPYDAPTGSNLARSNAFPAVASDGNQKLMLTFQAYSDPNGLMAPASLTNTPRILATYSKDGGGSWSTPAAVDYGPHLNTHQFMPRAAYSGGQWSIIFYDARYDLCFEQEPANPMLCGRNLNVVTVGSANYYFPTGKDRRFDLRVVQGQFDASGESLSFNLPSTQVTQYETRKDNGQIVQRDGGNCISPGCPALNYPFLTVGGGGASSWMGDYIAHSAKVQFLRNPPGPSVPAWRFANQPGDPTTFLAFWADFRSVAFPLTNGIPNINGDWTQWIPAGLAGCINPKTRDVNVMFSEITDGGLSASVRSTSQRPGIPPEFTVNLQNLSGRDLFVRLQIFDSAPSEDWSTVQTLPLPAAVPADDNLLDIKILKNSSVTKTVYYRWRSAGINESPALPVLVRAYEVTGLPSGAPGGSVVPNGLSTNVTYNVSLSPSIGGAIHGVSVTDPAVSFGRHTRESFTYTGQPSNNLIENNLIENNLIENNLIENNLIENNLIENNLIENNLIENSLVEDQQVVWTVTGTGALTTAATAFSNVVNGQALLQEGWVFQLLIYQTQLNPKVFECTQLLTPTDLVLSNIAITEPNGFFPNTDNFQVSNNLIENNLIENNLIENSPLSEQVSNATFPVDLQEQIHIALRAFRPPSSSMSLEIFNPDDDAQIGQAVFGQAADPLTGASVGDFFDTTPPVITPVVSPSPNLAGWHNTTPVSVRWTVRDAQSGILSTVGCADQSINNETPGAVLTCEATNHAGLSSAASVTVKIDTTKPTATAIPDPAPNASGWNNTNVTVAFTGSDALSQIDFCSPSVTLSGEGANQIASGTCTDIAGNLSDAASATVNIDKTKPVIVGIALPPPNANGWNNTNVTVSFTCSDSTGSGLAVPFAEDVVVSTEGTNQSRTNTGSCVDRAGNTADAVTVNGINIDKTKPVISGSRAPLPNASGWNNTDVTVSFTCSDNGGSGVEVNTVIGGVVSTEGADQSRTSTGACVDRAGNTADPLTVNGINIDRTAPAVMITAPANGANYVLNSIIAAAYSCNDALSGITSTGCAGTVPVGANFSTSTVGPNVFSVNAADKAGNVASKSANYSVVYSFVLTPPKSPANLGSAVPLIWQLRDAGNNTINSLNSLRKLESVFNGSAVPPGGCKPSATGTLETLYSFPNGATGNSSFRLVSAGYQFNWDTTTATTAPVVTGKGCYTILISLDDLSAPKMTTVQLK